MISNTYVCNICTENIIDWFDLLMTFLMHARHGMRMTKVIFHTYCFIQLQYSFTLCLLMMLANFWYSNIWLQLNIAAVQIVVREIILNWNKCYLVVYITKHVQHRWPLVKTSLIIWHPAGLLWVLWYLDIDKCLSLCETTEIRPLPFDEPENGMMTVSIYQHGWLEYCCFLPKVN